MASTQDRPGFWARVWKWLRVVGGLIAAAGAVLLVVFGYREVRRRLSQDEESAAPSEA